MKTTNSPCFLLVIAAVVISSAAAVDKTNAKDGIIQKLLNGYDKSEPPQSNKQTEVKVGMYVNSISVDTLRMEYSITIYWRQAWKDARLAYACNDTASCKDQPESLRLPESAHNNIWVPDTFFRNEKKASLHTITVPNSFIKLSKNGSIWNVQKLSATLGCPMNLSRFPMDTQHCHLTIESFSYKKDNFHISPMDLPIEIYTSTQLSGFSVIDKIVKDCSVNYSVGAYSCQDFIIVLKRDFNYYMKQAYVPSFFIVIIASLSFWLAADATTRVLIGLFAILATMFIDYRVTIGVLPKLSVITALDVWTTGCQVFIFLSLVETAVVLVLYQRAKKSATADGGKASNDHQSDSEGIASKVDFFARFCYPAGFLFFTVVYSIGYAI